MNNWNIDPAHLDAFDVDDNDAFELVTVDEFGFKTKISSNGIKRCAKCKVLITPDNDSGWEIFVSGYVTQPECIDCWNYDQEHPITTKHFDEPEILQ